MPNLKGSLVDVSVSPSTATEVQLRAVRPHVTGQKVILREPSRVKIDDGEFQVNVVPGEAVLTVLHAGRPQESIPLRVLDGQKTIAEAVRLADESWGEFEPSTSDELKQEIITQVGIAEAARDEAKSHAADVQASVETAKNSADNASEAAVSAMSSAEEAEKWSKKSYDDERESLRHANNAARSKNTAKDAAKKAESAADKAAKVAEDTSWDGDRLTVNGKQSPHLKGPKGDPGDANVTWDDIQDVPMAETVTGPGLVTRDDKGWIDAPSGTPPRSSSVATRGWVESKIELVDYAGSKNDVLYLIPE